MSVHSANVHFEPSTSAEHVTRAFVLDQPDSAAVSALAMMVDERLSRHDAHLLDLDAKFEKENKKLSKEHKRIAKENEALSERVERQNKAVIALSGKLSSLEARVVFLEAANRSRVETKAVLLPRAILHFISDRSKAVAESERGQTVEDETHLESISDIRRSVEIGVTQEGSETFRSLRDRSETVAGNVTRWVKVVNQAEIESPRNTAAHPETDLSTLLSWALELEAVRLQELQEKQKQTKKKTPPGKLYEQRVQIMTFVDAIMGFGADDAQHALVNLALHKRPELFRPTLKQMERFPNVYNLLSAMRVSEPEGDNEGADGEDDEMDDDDDDDCEEYEQM